MIKFDFKIDTKDLEDIAKGYEEETTIEYGYFDKKPRKKAVNGTKSLGKSLSGRKVGATSTTDTVELNKTCDEGVPGASGLAFWKCNCDNKLIDCAFETSQPNYTLCQSEELINITQSV